MNANQVFQWRRQYRKRQLGGRAMKLLPATVADTATIKASHKRHWSAEAKQRIVEAALAAGASVKQIAQAHGLRPSQVYDWRKKHRRKRRATKAVNLLPVALTEAGQKTATNMLVRAIEIELPKGRMRIMGADAALLRAALELLR